MPTHDQNIVDWAAMHSAQQEIDQATQTANGYNTQAGTIITDLEAAWKSGAGAKFSQALDKWRQDFKNNIDQLVAVSTALGGSKNAYMTGEQSQNDHVNSLMSQL